jgi:hypothetical protein
MTDKRPDEALEREETWDWDAAEVVKPAQGAGKHIVVSVVLNRSEFDRISALAERSGKTLAQFLRDSGLEQASASRRE